MTPLSDPLRDDPPIRPFGRVLARPSQSFWGVVSALTWCAAAALSTSGCIIADPPDAQLPTKTPPLLTDANPVLTQVVPVPLDTAATQVTFTVRVRSEDLGDPLSIQPILNYNTDRELLAGRAIFEDPSYFDDTSRQISFPLSNSLLEIGCEQFTLFVTHRGNLTGSSELIDPEDFAIVTWWLDVHTSSSTPATLDSCPKKSGSAGG